MPGDVFGPASQGLWVYKSYAQGKMNELEDLTKTLRNTDPQDAAKLNDIQIKINAIQTSINYAQDVASLILTVTKAPQ